MGEINGKASTSRATSSAASRSGGWQADNWSASVTPLHELADEVRHLRRLADPLHGHDKRVPELGHAPRLAQEAVQLALAG